MVCSVKALSAEVLCCRIKASKSVDKRNLQRLAEKAKIQKRAADKDVLVILANVPHNKLANTSCQQSAVAVINE